MDTIRRELRAAKDIVGVLENAGISVSENLVHCVKADLRKNSKGKKKKDKSPILQADRTLPDFKPQGTVTGRVQGGGLQDEKKDGEEGPIPFDILKAVIFGRSITGLIKMAGGPNNLKKVIG